MFRYAPAFLVLLCGLLPAATAMPLSTPALVAGGAGPAADPLSGTALADRLAAIAEATRAAADPVAAFLDRAEDEARLAHSWLEDRTRAPGETLAAFLRAAAEDARAEVGRRGGKAAARQPGQDDAVGWARAFADLGLERRRLRLAHLATTAPHVVFARRGHIRPSFIGYTEGLSDARAERHFHRGGALCILELGANDGQVRTLVDDPQGMIRDPDVSHDGKRILFAWKKSDRNDDYHLFEMDAQAGTTTQLTFGLGAADYEGSYLPDGGIVFSSSRAEHGVPCYTTEVSNLYRIERNGANLRRLAVDQVHALYPKATDDGRIVYTRWDYNDRGQNFPQPLFQMNLDGTGQAAVYGANSWFPTSLLHTRQIPGTNRFLSVASGHHSPQQGSVVEIDPSVGKDEGVGMSFVAPRRVHPYERVDSAMQRGDLFAYPYPLGKEQFLASWLPAGTNKDRKKPMARQFALCWFDYDGAREMLAYDERASSFHAVPLRARPQGHVRPDLVKHDADTGTILISDVYQGPGMQGIPRGTAKALRVVEVRYRAATVGVSYNRGPDGGSHGGTPIAVANGSWDIKAIIGETPIHPDGSVHVEVPAMKSLYYQVLDERGQAIQTMRTWDTVQPGETKSCIGCHAYYDSVTPPAQARTSLALKAGRTRLTPFAATGWDGFSFPRHVQPILDAKCVSCHDGKDAKRMDLRGDVPDADARAKRSWSRAYTQLTAATHGKPLDNSPVHQWTGNPDGPWVKWISKMSEVTPLKPRHAGSAVSPMMAMLAKGHGKLSDAEYRVIATWIDLLVPFAGDYREGADWSPRDDEFYAYYEDKRRLNKRDEAEEQRRRRAGTDAEAWFAADLPTLTVSHERGGTALGRRTFPPRELVGGATFALPEALRPGDVLRVDGGQALMLRLGDLPASEIHAPGARWSWTVPGHVAKILPPALTTTKGLAFHVRPLRDAERSAYRNLACNVFADPAATATAFPHATASSTCRNDPVFQPRNAIDGFIANTGHGGFPHQSWGPEKGDGPSLAVDFGRSVRLDRVDLVLRADFPHDEHWQSVELVLDGRVVAKPKLERSAAIQTFTFPPGEGRCLELRNLRWNKEGWCALSELRAWGLDADRTPKARISQAGASGALRKEPLQ